MTSIVLILVVTACGGPAKTATGPATASPVPSATAALVVPIGFATTAVTIKEPDGTLCQRCMLLAATEQLRERGLMGVTSLDGFDGMVFLFDQPVHDAFWMKDTIAPLQIAFIADDGSFMRQFDMPPCLTAQCPTYGPIEKFRMAIETFAGQLATVGLVPGSTTTLGLPCQPKRTA